MNGVNMRKVIEIIGLGISKWVECQTCDSICAVSSSDDTIKVQKYIYSQKESERTYLINNTFSDLLCSECFDLNWKNYYEIN